MYQEPDTQSSYDRIADEYARQIYGELAGKPLDRAILDRFAERLRGRGAVCDMGCGPGQIGRYLADRGLPVVGVDLSPAMLSVARSNLDRAGVRTVKSPADLGSAMHELLFKRRRSAAKARQIAPRPAAAQRKAAGKRSAAGKSKAAPPLWATARSRGNFATMLAMPRPT